LEILGESHQAWNLSGSTAAKRDASINRLNRLVRELFGKHLYDVRAASASQFRGFTRDLLLVLCMNRDARHHIKSLNPHVERILVEHSLDTDGLETVFGMIVMRLGYKSTYVRIMAAMRTNERVAQMKRDGDSLVTVCSSSKRRYTHHLATAKRHAEWNDGSLMDSEAFMKMLTRVAKVSGAETAPNHNIARDLRTSKAKQNFVPSTI